MRLKELREERGSVIGAARALLDKAESEKRDLSDEESGLYDQYIKKSDELHKRIEREERQQELDRQAASRAADKQKEDASVDHHSGRPKSKRATEEYREIFGRYLTGGRDACSPDEIRALAADVGTQGGYLVAPEQFVADLLKSLDDQVFIRPLATKFRVDKAESLGAPSLDADPADSDWTTELQTGNEDSAMSFGKRELHPHPVSKRLKVSNKLLTRSTMPVEQIVRDRLAYKFAITQEKAFLTGNGANKPLGLFVASAMGIPTSRDVATDNTGTSITFDGLYNAKYALKGAYWPKAQWLFHRDALKQISKLKDTQNRYLWEPSQQVGQPDLLLGKPVMMSEYVPNTFTVNQYVGMFADFSYYWIADAMDLQVQRLVELYAETNQVGFIGRLESDGMPALAEAFVRVQLAAA